MGIYKETRTKMLSIRISESELELLDKICSKRKIIGNRRSSRISVIIDALKYADGQINFNQ